MLLLLPYNPIWHEGGRERERHQQLLQSIAEGTATSPPPLRKEMGFLSHLLFSMAYCDALSNPYTVT
jgi:hypothetical protein